MAGTSEVERVGRARVSVARRVVNTCHEADLPAGSEVIHEARRLEYFKDAKYKRWASFAL